MPMPDIQWGKLAVDVILALFAAIPPSILAYAALQQGRKNGAEVKAVAFTTDQIHILTNSNLSAVKTDLALANQRIERLQALIAGMLDKDGSGQKEHAND